MAGSQRHQCRLGFGRIDHARRNLDQDTAQPRRLAPCRRCRGASRGSLIPTLDWTGGLVGVRFALQPKDEENLAHSFHDALHATQALKDAWRSRAETEADDQSIQANSPTEGAGALSDGPIVTEVNGASEAMMQQPTPSPKVERDLSLWPNDLIDFLSKHFQTHLELRQYVLDPEQFQSPKDDCARVQDLPQDAKPLASNPLAEIVLIDEINAQRGLGDVGEQSPDASTGRISDTTRLSRQLSDYYTKHLDPAEHPGPEDLDALETIAIAQHDFDDRLKQAFRDAFEEMAELSYPGVTDPRIRVASKLSATESLKHESAVSFELDRANGSSTSQMYLPEGQNGLGYQNLISMIFRLMSFRDRWLHVGKAAKPALEASIQPIHLVLIEEPEARLSRPGTASLREEGVRRASQSSGPSGQIGTCDAARDQHSLEPHRSRTAF